MAAGVILMNAVVLAGGKSKRMGRDKLFIEVEGKRLIERVLDTLGLIFDDITIIAAADETLEKFNWIRRGIVRDLIPDKASMGGLYTALSYAATERIFVVGGDMPFLNEDLIRYIISKEDYDVVIPRTTTGLHPLHAVYSKGCLPVIRDMINEGDLSISRFVCKMTRYEVGEEEILRIDPDLASLININAPADLEMIKRVPYSGWTRGGQI